jgi:HAD superfamily hydrolase (TIGR01509 family)
LIDDSFDGFQARAVVFDWDGTLVNTQDAYVCAWRFALDASGYQATRGDLEYVLGRALPDCLRYFQDRFPRLEPTRFERDWRADFGERLATGIAVYRDAARCLRTMVRLRIPVAIATQTPRADFDRARAIAGLADVDVRSVCRTEVARPKPAPDIYLRACHLLTLEPAECLAIEDSLVGVVSARDAGLRVLGIARSPVTRQAIEKAADLTVTKLKPRKLRQLVGTPHDERSRLH